MAGKKRGAAGKVKSLKSGATNEASLKKKKKKEPAEIMNTTDFLSRGLDSLDSDSSDDENIPQAPEPVMKKEEKKSSVKKTKSHKQQLTSLQEKDPEFYEFLKNEDQGLLNFNESDSDDDGEEEENEGDGESDSTDEDSQESDVSDSEPGVHKPPAKLEVASDDSEAEEEEDRPQSKKSSKRTLVTLKMVNQWSKSLQESNSIAALSNAVSAFRAAVHHSETDPAEVTKFKVEGSTVFNAVVRMCLADILPMLSRFLALPKQKDSRKPVQPSSSSKWTRVRITVKSYLTDVIQMLSEMGDAAILNVLLKHVHQLTPYYVCLPKLAKQLIKKLILLWSSGDETSRVLAFLSINKITVALKDSMLEYVLKQMYTAYVKNCKFTSPTTLPVINFMQRALVEMFALDMQMAYQYAFIYIRQLAIHLRNAITVKKKETCQAVYNWQYIHSLNLWVRLVGALHSYEVLRPLIYPLTQTIIGTIKLIPTARYYPLRFHCVRALNTLSQTTHTYIPVLPFIVEVFELTDFNKKHKNISFKPFNFACILKLSKAQVAEKSFKDGIIDQLYELLLEHFNIHSHTIGFPELVLPSLILMKQFLKQCKVANYTRQIKQIVEKVEETSKVITQRRKTAVLNISESKAVEAWEVRSREEGTPLSKFYSTWRKLRDRELQAEIAGKERISEDDRLPRIERPTGPRKATEEDRKEFGELFETDSEDEDDETRFLPKNERPKKKQKTADSEDDSDQEYSDFDDDELEQLAHSASEEEGADSEEEDSSGDEDEEDDDDGEGGDDDSTEDKDDIVEDFKFSDDESD